MNLEQAIETALELERNVLRAYNDASEKATDPVGKRVFKFLAKEEAGHVSFLKACQEQWKKDGNLTVEGLETAVPSVSEIDEATRSMKETVETRASKNPQEIELLERAIKAEDEVSTFYKQMVAELDEDGQKLFARFVEIEEGHAAIVRAELDSLKGHGAWFDFEEWGFTDG